MKRSVEDLLREALLTAPSRSLAERIEEAFSRAARRGPRWYAAPIPLWVCVTAALVCASLGYLAHDKTSPPAVVYVLPVEGELRRVLNGEAQRPPDDFYRGLRVSVKTEPGRKL
jgi:hypothetical protein